MNTKHILTFLFLFSFFIKNSAQSIDQPSTVTTLNSYVQFTNEGIHGMLIVHRLLENFNQEINKYVKLQSNQLNFYGNSDLPKNVFIDKEQSFYRVSPFLWYEVVKKESKSLNRADAKKLNTSVDNLKTIMTQVNNVRFEIEKFISNNDLTKKENLETIYEKLENCVKLYENFYRIKETLQKDLFEVYKNNISSQNTRTTPEIQMIIQYHKKFLTVSKALRYSQTSGISNKIFELFKVEKSINKVDIKNPFFKKSKLAINDINVKAKAYGTGQKFSEKYTLYGMNYFYHNVELTSGFNSYGSGFVEYANKYIKNTHPTGLLLIEEPHYYKVIYPEEEIKDIPKEEPIEPIEEVVIEELPTEINNRELIVKKQNVMVDTLYLNLSIYDHKEQDGDIISINFNGKWILENHKLTNSYLNLKIKLNEQGENYLVLHAENLGDTPPNTAAVQYKLNGKNKRIILNSNLNESEMIRLQYLPK